MYRIMVVSVTVVIDVIGDPVSVTVVIDVVGGPGSDLRVFGGGHHGQGDVLPPNKEPKEGERKLYLAIEATSDMAIQKAKKEITRLIKDELIRLVSLPLSLRQHPQIRFTYSCQSGNIHVLLTIWLHTCTTVSLATYTYNCQSVDI